MERCPWHISQQELSHLICNWNVARSFNNALNGTNYIWRWLGLSTGHCYFLCFDRLRLFWTFLQLFVQNAHRSVRTSLILCPHLLSSRLCHSNVSCEWRRQGGDARREGLRQQTYNKSRTVNGEKVLAKIASRCLVKSRTTDLVVKCKG